MKRYGLFTVSLLFILAACGPKPTTAPTAAPAATAVPTKVAPAETAWPPAGIIAFSRANSANLGNIEDYIYLINTDGSGLVQLTNGSQTFTEHPTWSPDGTRIAYHSGSGRNLVAATLWNMKADGSGQTQLTQLPPGSFFPTWSPDGTRIAYNISTSDSGPFHIGLMNADGSNRVVLTDGAIWDIWPAWAPDGSILFIRKDGFVDSLKGDVFSIQPDGSGLTQVTKIGFVGGFALSPDGTRIAYQDMLKHQIMLAPIEAGGTALTLVDMVTYSDSFTCYHMALSWSPDGQVLAMACSDFTTGAMHTSDIYLVKADGSKFTKIPNTTDSVDPVWKPK